jgi:hypothetical protein
LLGAGVHICRYSLSRAGSAAEKACPGQPKGGPAQCETAFCLHPGPVQAPGPRRTASLHARPPDGDPGIRARSPCHRRQERPGPSPSPASPR